MKDPTPPDIPWAVKIIGMVFCVGLSAGIVTAWESFQEIRSKAAQAEECGR